MDFIEYANNWSKSEVTQARIMIGIGILLLIAMIAIIKNENDFLKGMIIPMSLLLVILIGYGGYILYSRPAHVKQSIEFFKESTKEAVTKEVAKHTNDNKAGNTLLKIYPILMLASIIMLFFMSDPYYKGLAIGLAVLFISMYIIDYGFVSRSNSFLTFLSELKLTD